MQLAAHPHKFVELKMTFPDGQVKQKDASEQDWHDWWQGIHTFGSVTESVKYPMEHDETQVPF
jgi:hypothetical protein